MVLKGGCGGEGWGQVGGGSLGVALSLRVSVGQPTNLTACPSSSNAGTTSE